MHFLDAESTLFPVATRHDFRPKRDLHFRPGPHVIFWFVTRTLSFLKETHKMISPPTGAFACVLFFSERGGSSPPPCRRRVFVLEARPVSGSNQRSHGRLSFSFWMAFFAKYSREREWHRSESRLKPASQDFSRRRKSV